MNVKNLVLGIGIIVVFALTLWQGIEAFYPSPQYDDFCKLDRYVIPTPIKAGVENCTYSYSRELTEAEDQCYNSGGSPVYEYNENGCIANVKECDLCNKEYTEASDAHAKIVFYIALIAGILALVVGFSILSIEPVGSALIGSGIWSVFYGTVINWRNFSNIWRFLLLLLVLILLIWITIRLNTAKKKKKGFWFSLGFRKDKY